MKNVVRIIFRGLKFHGSPGSHRGIYVPRKPTSYTLHTMQQFVTPQILAIYGHTPAQLWKIS